MTDDFASHAASLDGPANNAFAITPDDTTDLAKVTRALYVGIGGTLAVVMARGGEVTFENLSDGTLLPIRVSRVRTASTADAIVGLY